MSESVERLNELKFYGMKELLDSRLLEANKGGLTYEDFLGLLFEDESLYRKNKRSELLRKRAKFKDRVYLEDFRPSNDRGVTKSMVQQLKSLSFVDHNENLIFIGGTGAGKSFLAQAIGHGVCSAGIEACFISTNRLFKEIEVAEAQGTYLNYMARLRQRVKVLIIDDLGLRNYSHKEANILYEIFDDRYRKGPVIITSQVKPQGWKVLFEDEVIAEAIIDRVTSCAHIIHVKGPSFRVNNKVEKPLAKES